jgi:hypothetical protein
MEFFRGAWPAPVPPKAKNVYENKSEFRGDDFSLSFE